MMSIDLPNVREMPRTLETIDTNKMQKVDTLLRGMRTPVVNSLRLCLFERKNICFLYPSMIKAKKYSGKHIGQDIVVATGNETFEIIV